MSEATFDRALFLPDTFGNWYRARPFQIAFALSVVVHAGLIALVPGFRVPVTERPTVLSVKIVQPDENRPRSTQPPAVVPPPPRLVPQEPQPRPLEQAMPEIRPRIEPPPTPVLRQPEPSPEPVRRAELAPPMPKETPRPQPIVQPPPQPVPEQLSVPLIERVPAPDLEQPKLALPPVARAEPRPQPSAASRPDPIPAPSVVAPQPDSRPELPVVQAPVAPPPVARVEPRPPVQVRPPIDPLPQAPVPAPAQVQVPAPPPVAMTEPARPSPVREDAEVMQALTASFSQQVSSKIKRYQRYPMVAQRRGWEGTAEVLVRFDPDGRVADIVLGKSSGREILDEEAVNMVRRASPLPEAPQGLFGKEIKVPIVFRLQDS